MSGPLKSLVYVPTNRACADAIRAYANEAEWIHKSHHQTAFAVIESNRADHVAVNKMVLEAEDVPGGPSLLHFDVPRQETLLREITYRARLVDAEASLLRRALLPALDSYSAGPNKAILLACLLSVECLHRRDSDTVPSRVGAITAFPSGYELLVLGKPVAELALPRPLPANIDPMSVVAGAGTSYVGDEALDRREFERIAPSLLLEHERIIHPDASQEELTAIVDRKYRRSAIDDCGTPFIMLDDAGQSEMGSIAFPIPQTLCPELPIEATLGSDYFHKNLIYRLGLPLIYHSSKVMHASAARAHFDISLDAYVSYALKDARFKLMKQIWRVLNAAIEQAIRDSGRMSLAEFRDSQYGDCLALAQAGVSDSQMRGTVVRTANIYDMAAKIAEENEPSARVRFARASEAIRSNGEKMTHDIRQAFNDYIVLVRLWPGLCTAAAEVNPWTVFGQ